jgi:hypothetical protein
VCVVLVVYAALGRHLKSVILELEEDSTKVHNPGTREGQAQLNGLLSSQQPSYVLRSAERTCEILLAPDRICHHAVLSRLPVRRTHISVLLHDMV